MKVGRAGLSAKHILAIVNLGGAKAKDILSLAGLAKTEVQDKFGIELVPEPVFVGFSEEPD
jgi:UDP-N-acetylmuramate dehydrogenase